MDARLEDALVKLAALYREVDELYQGYQCAASTDCCRFGVTGREPQPTPLEFALLAQALRSSPPPKAKKLRVVAQDERRCPLLKDNGRCAAYANRPFGCRTFFCERARNALGEHENPMQTQRPALRQLGQRVQELAALAFPRDPLPRPLTTWLAQRR